MIAGYHQWSFFLQRDMFNPVASTIEEAEAASPRDFVSSACAGSSAANFHRSFRTF